jgi:probable HAF family extracellular repeat protein
MNTPIRNSIGWLFLRTGFVLIPIAVATAFALYWKPNALAVSDKNTAPVPLVQSYIVTDLGTLGGSLGSSAEAINSSGHVVGRSFTPGNATYHATLFSGTGSNNIDLGNLHNPPDNSISEAQGINDSGGIIGVSAAPPLRATLFSGTGSDNIDLGALNNSSLASAAYAINNAGEIVGFAEGAGNGHATHFSGTGSNNIDLGTLGGADSTAYAVNNSGQIVGKATTAQQADRATLFGGTNFDLGTLGGFNSSAYGINDAGQIVGDAAITGDGAFHATLFSGTGSNNVDLGTLGGTNSHAYAINSSSQIVGNSQYVIGNSGYHAFIYVNGTMTDLNDLIGGSGVSNVRLEDNGGRVPGKCINDAGQIAALGDVLGSTHAILLTPGGTGTPTPTPTATASPRVTPRPRPTPHPRPTP